MITKIPHILKLDEILDIAGSAILPRNIQQIVQKLDPADTQNITRLVHYLGGRDNAYKLGLEFTVRDRLDEKGFLHVSNMIATDAIDNPIPNDIRAMIDKIDTLLRIGAHPEDAKFIRYNPDSKTRKINYNPQEVAALFTQLEIQYDGCKIELAPLQTFVTTGLANFKPPVANHRENPVALVQAFPILPLDFNLEFDHLPLKDLPVKTTLASEPPTMTIPAEIHDARSPLERYLASFGARLLEHRESRNITRTELANEASRQLQPEHNITAEKIKFWEQARFGELPTNEQFEILSRILIDDNQQLTDKDAARAAFAEAYKQSILFNSGNTNLHEEARYSFADILIQLRESLMPRETLALTVNERMRPIIDEQEAALLHTNPENFIKGMEAGVILPSKHLMLALVKALNANEELSEGEKTALFAAHEAVEVVKDKPKDYVQRVSVKKPKAYRSRENLFSDENPNLEILDVKSAIKKIIYKNSESVKDLAFNIDVNATTLGSFFSGYTNPNNVGGFSENAQNKIRQHIMTSFGDDGPTKVAEYNELIARLRHIYSAKKEEVRAVA